MGNISVVVSRSLRVLGLILDDNLGFTEHINSVSAKAIGLYQKTSRAARATWGLKPDVLRFLYGAIAEPIMMYASGAWAHKASKVNIRRKLDRVTRAFAIQIAKAHRTTSMVAAALLAGIVPLHLRAQQRRSVYQVKKEGTLLELPGRQLQRRISVGRLPHPADRVPYIIDEVDETETEVNLDDQTVLFTDGSKLDGKVGASVSVWKGDREVFAAKIKLADHCTVYQAELCAIRKALEIVARRPGRGTYRILSDSLSSLMAIRNKACTNPLVFEIQNKLKEIEMTHGRVGLGWVKAHIGISGNERADLLAKSAALNTKTAPHYDNVPLSCARRLIRDRILEQWQHEYHLAETGKTTKIFFPDVRTAHKLLRKIKGPNNLTAQIFTGHGGYREYLYKYRLADSPFCTCDNVTEENVMHVLLNCPKHEYKRLEVECKMDIRLQEDTISKILEDDDRRNDFMAFAIAVVGQTVANNGGRAKW